MNIPLPPKSCGQIVNVAALVRVRLFDIISGKIIGSNSAANFLSNSATTSMVSERVRVQTAYINLPPGFTLGAACVSNCF